MRRGRFITLEGGEGAGKSTQTRLLSEKLHEAGIDHLTTREPGGTESAEAVRALLVRGEGERWLAESEALLMMTARFEHVKRVIEPALAAGKWVICDRFFDSTRIYQGVGRALGEAWLQSLYRLLFGNFQPERTFYLDLSPEAGIARTAARDNAETRFESLPLAFHQAVRSGFLAIAKAESARIITLDATQSPDMVAEQLWQHLRPLMEERDAQPA